MSGSFRGSVADFSLNTLYVLILIEILMLVFSYYDEFKTALCVNVYYSM